MKNRLVGALTVVILYTGGTLLAHHSFAAQYDANKPVTVVGTVEKLDAESMTVRPRDGGAVGAAGVEVEPLRQKARGEGAAQE